MARAKGRLHQLNRPELLQFLQTVITAATGNENAPTPTPSLAVLQALYDDGVDKNNAVTAAETELPMLRAEREAHMQSIIAALTTFIAYAEGATGCDPLKLQSLGLPLRNPRSPSLACGQVTGVRTTLTENEGQLVVKWSNQSQADSFEMQVSPDPLTSTNWVHAETVSVPRVTLNNQPSGARRWVRVRAVNRLGKGPWSNPACRMVP